MTIRRAVVGDARAISDAHVRSWQAAYRGMIPSEYLDSLSDRLEQRARFFTERLEAGAEIYVAEQDGIVGFVLIGTSEDGQHAELFAIYVDPDHWGEGHGHDLLVAAEERLAEMDHELSILWVLEGNVRARAFYEAHGWVDSKRSALLTIGGADVTEVRYEKAL